MLSLHLLPFFLWTPGNNLGSHSWQFSAPELYIPLLAGCVPNGFQSSQSYLDPSSSLTLHSGSSPPVDVSWDKLSPKCPLTWVTPPTVVSHSSSASLFLGDSGFGWYCQLCFTVLVRGRGDFCLSLNFPCFIQLIRKSHQANSEIIFFFILGRSCSSCRKLKTQGLDGIDINEGQHLKEGIGKPREWGETQGQLQKVRREPRQCGIP
jgi:hypothetical protein